MLHRTLMVFAGVCVLFGSGCANRPTSLLDGDGGSGAEDGNDGAGSQGGAGDGAGTSVGGSAEGGAGPQPASYVVTLDDGAPELELRDDTQLTVSVAANGYVGDVGLVIEGLPPDVEAALATTSISLEGNDTEEVTLSVSTRSDTVTGTFPFSVIAFSEGGDVTGDASLTVLPIITIVIPENLASYASDPPDQTAFGDYPTIVRALPDMSPENTITVNFYNADSVSHEIHADAGDFGFGHGNQPIPPLSLDPVVRNVNAPGQYDYYPHDLGVPNIIGRVLIQE
jgi:hypothetical protein